MSRTSLPRRTSVPKHCPDRVNVLLVGGGGREHALAWKISQSPRLASLWVTNGENPGLAHLGQPCPVKIELREMWRIRKWCDQQRIDLVVVGPEAPLAAGLADELASADRLIFGVNKLAAKIESDKAWAKQLLRSAAIPTAEGRVFSHYEQALQYLESRHEDIPVIKASGLAAGKGVIVPESLDEAREALHRIMKLREFGDAGEKVVIEERLVGPEISVLAIVDGRTIYVLEPCQDHKRLGAGDTGPNTGGMGAYCPVSFLDEQTLALIERDILVPTIDALRREEIDYRGVLYAGLILTAAGPKVLEFNCRFGDPECQPLMMRWRGDLLEVLWATAAGRLSDVQIDWDDRAACCVVMTSRGYPGQYASGMPIAGMDAAVQLDPESITIFHAGTRTASKGGGLVTGGGRVLDVCALGSDLLAARNLANKACELIDFEGAYFRSDIGASALGHLSPTGATVAPGVPESGPTNPPPTPLRRCLL